MRYVRAIGVLSAVLMTGAVLGFAKADELDDRLAALENENAALKKQIRLQALEKENAKLRTQLNKNDQTIQRVVRSASADGSVDVSKALAYAANNSRSQPIYKAPPAPIASTVFSWTGIYLGIGGGTGWGAKDYTFDQDTALAATVAPLFSPGFLSPPLNSGKTSGSHAISGEFFGGQVGGNWQAGWAVFGIQADAHWADIRGHGSCFDGGVFLLLMRRSTVVTK